MFFLSSLWLTSRWPIVFFFFQLKKFLHTISKDLWTKEVHFLLVKFDIPTKCIGVMEINPNKKSRLTLTVSPPVSIASGLDKIIIQ